MVTLTQFAIDKVKSILAGQEENNGLRIQVAGAECSGFQYRMTLEKEPAPGDEVLDIDGLKLFLDRRSLLHLDGTRIDFIENERESGFKFENPGVRPACGCGETFEA
ncbi:MAG: iron-sulfur cluster assembly accessory protein [Acidobacteria bacterium]|nr:iron-sulfur cluster assembly accessory protein [Acidobacteriota bacterium]